MEKTLEELRSKASDEIEDAEEKLDTKDVAGTLAFVRLLIERLEEKMCELEEDRTLLIDIHSHAIEERDREISELRHAGTEFYVEQERRRAWDAAREEAEDASYADGLGPMWLDYEDWRASLKS